MTPAYIPAALRERIRRRAADRCEYCLLAEEDAGFPHEPDHIVAEKHGGDTSPENMALACFDCNRFKGSDIASLDPVTRSLVPLYNPRTDRWADHFRIEQGAIRPLTPTARATARLLKLNLPVRIEVRATLTKSGRYPG